MAYKDRATRRAADQARAANLIGGDSGAGARFTVTGEDKINRRLRYLAKWSKEHENQVVNLNRRVAIVYLGYLNANIKDFDRDILVQFKDREGFYVRRGTLRRSLGSYQPEDYDKTKLIAGPLTKNIGGRKKGVRTVNGRASITKMSDGWFAHIVEGGDSFGKKKTTVNTGVFMKGKRATQNRAMKLRNRLLKKEFSNFIREALLQ